MLSGQQLETVTVSVSQKIKYVYQSNWKGAQPLLHINYKYLMYMKFPAAT